jgi:hypothetical protein
MRERKRRCGGYERVRGGRWLWRERGRSWAGTPAGKSEVREDSDGRVPSVSGRKAKIKEKKGVTVRFDYLGRVAGPDWTTPVQNSFFPFFLLYFILFCFHIFLYLLHK